MLKLYGRTPAADFNATALEAVHAEMIRMNWCRNTINRQILGIKSVVGWAVGRELVPAGMVERLDAVKGLRRAQGLARETAPIRPVDEACSAVFDHLSPQVQAMVES